MAGSAVVTGWPATVSYDGRMRTATYLQRFFDGAPDEVAGCLRCRGHQDYGGELRMAFQPIIDAQRRDIFAYEALVRDHQQRGLLTAIDDFGAGYSGLNLLAEFQPNLVKLDMALVHDIDRNHARQAIVGGVLGTCRALGVQVIAEGVESRAEYDWLRSAGVTLFQGYLVARPAVEALPEPDWAALA